VASLGELLANPGSRSKAIESMLIDIFSSQLASYPPEIITACFWVLDPLSQVDAIKKAFAASFTYPRLYSSFLRAFPEEKGMAIPAWKLLSKGDDILTSLSSELPNLPGSLQTLSEGLEPAETLLDVLGMLLDLSGYYDSHQEAFKLAKEETFKRVLGKDKYLRNRALNRLMMAAAIDQSRPVMVAMGTKSLVSSFLDDPSSEHGFLACMVLALISASDQGEEREKGKGHGKGKGKEKGRHEHGGGSEVAEDETSVSFEVVQQVLKIFDSFANKPLKEVHVTYRLVVYCDTVLIALRSLATNEANLRLLKEADLVPRLMNFFQNRVSLSHDENQDHVAEVHTLLILPPFSFLSCFPFTAGFLSLFRLLN